MRRIAVVVLLVVLLAPAGAGAAQFKGTVSPLSPDLRARMTGVSWHRGCPVPLRDLRLLTLRHRGFDGTVRTGELVVHEDVAGDVVEVFRRLFAAGYPIRKIRLIDAYGGERLPFDRGRQHLGVQLPPGHGLGELVEPRLREGHRPQPDREPLRRGRARLPRCEPPLRRPLEAAPGDGARRRRRRPLVRGGRLGLGRLLVGKRQGLPALLLERALSSAAQPGPALPGLLSAP